MNLLWITCSASSLDTRLANFLEAAVALQKEGKVVATKVWKIKPVLYLEDKLYGRYNPEAFMDHYKKLYKSEDPAKQMEMYMKNGKALYMYSPDTFKLLGIDPSKLLLDPQAVAPSAFLRQLIGFIEQDDKQPRWVLAGHNVKYVSSVLNSYSARVDEEFWPRFNRLVNVENPIDTVPFFRVVGAFHNEVSVSLPKLAKSYGFELGSMSAQSKLQFLLKTVDAVIRRREDVIQFLSDSVSSENIR